MNTFIALEYALSISASADGCRVPADNFDHHSKELEAKTTYLKALGMHKTTAKSPPLSHQ